MANERLDSKGRKLRVGESIEKGTGRYKYTYRDENNNRKVVYSWTLTANDKVPAGKNQRSGESLREKEARIQKDLIEGINSSGGNMSLYDLMELYIKIRWKDQRYYRVGRGVMVR